MARPGRAQPKRSAALARLPAIVDCCACMAFAWHGWRPDGAGLCAEGHAAAQDGVPWQIKPDIAMPGVDLPQRGVCGFARSFLGAGVLQFQDHAPRVFVSRTAMSGRPCPLSRLYFTMSSVVQNRPAAKPWSTFGSVRGGGGRDGRAPRFWQAEGRRDCATGAPPRFPASFLQVCSWRQRAGGVRAFWHRGRRACGSGATRGAC